MYGGACSGVFFDASTKKCLLKGTHTSTLSFIETEEAGGVDLVGGCNLWANVGE
jgi:hypothetical protein